MLSDGTLRGIKPQATTYKIADRDGMYVTVSPRGTITFRLDYRCLLYTSPSPRD